MAPKIRYDAAEMQAKANEVAEKEIRVLAREGAEVACEYLGTRFETDTALHGWVQAVVPRQRSRS